jgi:peroxiredoxin
VELPRLETLWQKYRDQGLAVLAVESTRDTENAVEFITDNDLTYHLVEDVDEGEKVVSDTLRIYGFPTSFLVDREGRIIYHHLGFHDGDEARLEEEIRKLLG